MLETACLTEHTAEGNTAEGETVDLDGEQTNLGAAGPANSVVEYTVVDLEAEAAGMAALFGAASTVGSRTPSLAALSWAQTDYSELLPPLSFDEEIPLTEKYDVESVVQSAWKSLPSDNIQLPWEANFWDTFLDPNVSALDMMHKSMKRPLPVQELVATGTFGAVEVERRVSSKTYKEVTNFLQFIKDVPEKSWQEEREALWETAIRRWVALLDSWDADNSAVAKTLQDLQTFSEKAQILVDIFFNKAPQTLMKRVNSLLRVTERLHVQGVKFPCSEEQFYRFLKSEAQSSCAASRLKSFFEAVVFARHVLGVHSLQAIVESKRCLGAASSLLASHPLQADPFTVNQLEILHGILREGCEPWDRAMAGMLLFCVYGRSRWSDAQHAERLIEDSDDKECLRFLEIHTSVHKTARALHLRHMFLPVVAPAQGVTKDCCGEQWVRVRRLLNIDDLGQYPLMPAPDSSLKPTRRPVSTGEAKQWIAYLLGAENMKTDAKLTSHSCKCTCLSFMAKRGASFEDRLVLGYHANKLRTALTYSRDSAARPLALLENMLREIREGIFEPDATRSGRLKPGAKPLDPFHAELLSDLENVEREPALGVRSQAMPHAVIQEIPENPGASNLEPRIELQERPKEADSEANPGHVTTSSSDSDSELAPRLSPVVGHYQIGIPDDKRLWWNQNSKMFHLAFEEHTRTLLCGRKISSGIREHSGPVRFDSAKCKLCFRLKEKQRW